MPKISKKVTTVFVILACLAVGYGAKFLSGLYRGNMPTGQLAKVKGHDNAAVKITEFIDFQCPACALGAKYLKEEMQRHPGAIRLQLKHFPLEMHRHGLLSARYAECAAQLGQFWPFHDLLLARQGNWQRLEDARPAFARMAADVNLDSQELEACLQDNKVDKIIEENKTEGKRLGVRSTPTYFVNGKMVVGKESLVLEINGYLDENSH